MYAPHPWRRAGALLLLLPLAAAVPARAQLVYHGFERIDQSDATFVSITSADMLGLEAVPARSYACTVAWGVRDAASAAGEALAAGTLSGAPAGTGSLRRDVQQELHALMYGRGSGVRLTAGLTRAGSSRAAEAAAAELIRRLDGLLSAAERMDPVRPGVAVPTRVAAALAAFDDYLDATPAAFLADPSDELLGVHAVLTRLVNGGIRYNGMACPLVAGETGFTPQDSSMREEMRPFDLCTLQESGPVWVYGGITSAGDSIAVVEGQHRALREAYPALPSVLEAGWYHSGADLSLGGQRYVKWSASRDLVPGSVALFTRHEGVNVYAAPGVQRPNAVYVPVRGCEFHEYRLARTSANARG